MANEVTKLIDRSITEVNLDSDVTVIGDYAFSKCYSLTSVTMGNSVTAIGADAFRGCTGLTNITIPSTVTAIYSDAFRGCTGLTSVTVNASTPPTLYSHALDGTNDCPIYVSAESVDTYKAASGWSNYASRIQAIPS